MQAQGALVQFLRDDKAITNLAGQRIWSLSMVQGAKRPAIVVTHEDTEPTYCDDGDLGLDRVTFEIDCEADSYPDVKALADAVKARVSGYAGPVRGGAFQGLYIEGEDDIRGGGSNEAEYPYIVNLRLSGWFQRGI